MGGHVAWNNVTQRLLAAQIDGLFARFPGVDGLLVRTGETYTYDDPYWGGNSPTAGVPSGAAQIEVWVSFITWLRQEVCERHGKALYFRAWDSFAGWTGDPAYYLNVTDPVPTHPSLYFSVKHTAGDFFRYMAFNGQVGVGKHAQIIEVELQREYEGKMATPDCESGPGRPQSPASYTRSRSCQPRRYLRGPTSPVHAQRALPSRPRV